MSIEYYCYVLSFDFLEKLVLLLDHLRSAKSEDNKEKNQNELSNLTHTADMIIIMNWLKK